MIEESSTLFFDFMGHNRIKFLTDVKVTVTGIPIGEKVHGKNWTLSLVIHVTSLTIVVQTLPSSCSISTDLVCFQRGANEAVPGCTGGL